MLTFVDLFFQLPHNGLHRLFHFIFAFLVNFQLIFYSLDLRLITLGYIRKVIISGLLLIDPALKFCLSSKKMPVSAFKLLGKAAVLGLNGCYL